MNPEAGKIIYYLHFTLFGLQFLKGIAGKYDRGHMDVTEVYVTPEDYRKVKVGEVFKGNQANFSKNFKTPLKKVLKYKLQKYLIQSVFDPEGKHDWFDWRDHGGKSVKYIL